MLSGELEDPSGFRFEFEPKSEGAMGGILGMKVGGIRYFFPAGFMFCFYFGGRVSVAKAGLKLLPVLLPQPLKC